MARLVLNLRDPEVLGRFRQSATVPTGSIAVEGYAGPDEERRNTVSSILFGSAGPNGSPIRTIESST